MLINCVELFERAEKWWESRDITGASIVIPMILLAFIARELLARRLLLPFGQLKKKNLFKGLFFLFLLGLFLPSSIQGTFTAGGLYFETIRNSELNLYLFPGV